jgi:hypothetical protein
VGALVVGALPGASAATKANPYPRDKKLSLQDVQMLGTHNSYHLRPDRPLVPNEPADYEHPPIDVQLSDQGVRSLEFDAYNGPTLPVLHTIIIDERSTCATIADCLGSVNTWSRANPGHVPLVLIIEAKDLSTNANPTIQQVVDNYNSEHNLTNWDGAALDRLDTTVRAADQPLALRSENLSAALEPLRSIQLRIVRPPPVVSFGAELSEPAGDVSGSTVRPPSGAADTASCVSARRPIVVTAATLWMKRFMPTS